MELVSIIKSKEDPELNVRLAKKGDKEAFKRLVASNKLSMNRVAISILGNSHDIEDAIQNTIMKAYQGVINLKKDEFFKTWLIRILINECNTLLKKRNQTVFIDDICSGKTINENFENLELTSAVNSLEIDLRVVTTLFYFEDIPQKEIAKMLDIPLGTVSSRLVRARSKLYEMLKEI